MAITMTKKEKDKIEKKLLRKGALPRSSESIELTHDGWRQAYESCRDEAVEALELAREMSEAADQIWEVLTGYYDKEV